MATKANTAAPPDRESLIKISKIAAETMIVPLIGTAPLICHKWSEKARRQMLENAQGKRRVKEPKDPVAEYKATLYRIANNDGGEEYGFPAVGFKAAMVSASRFFDKSVTMVAIRQSIFTHGVMTKADDQPLVPIVGIPQMREDVVTVGVSGHENRFRGEFPEWSVDLQITFVSSMFDRESVLSLLDAAGMGIGVGEWRPEKNGMFGTFDIDTTRDIQVVS